MLRKLSILVPVFDEAATVEKLLRRLAEVPFPIAREILVVDDGSSDDSPRILGRLAGEGLIKLFVHENNQGKGAAVRTALAHATGQVVVIQDADLELDPFELPKLLKPILVGEAQVCYGSRFLTEVPAAIRRLPTYWANRILNAISNRLNRLRLSDFNTCYKMLTREVASRIRITENGFAMEPEITAKIARLGYTIVERPVRYQPRSGSAGKKIRMSDLFRYLAAMVRYRFLPIEPSRPAAGRTATFPVSAPIGEITPSLPGRVPELPRLGTAKNV